MTDSHVASAGASRAPGRLRRLLVLLAVLVLSVGGGPALLVLPVAPADAVYATPAGGSGRFPTHIDWMDWDSATFAAGSTTTQWSTPQQVGTGYWRTTQCTITVDGTYAVGRYEPGAWAGDALARLYNNGVNYTGGVRKSGVTASGLLIGLQNVTRATTSTFRLACTAYIVQWTGSNAPSEAQISAAPKTRMPAVGMVVADAESSNFSSSEYLAVSPVTAPTAYRHLETERVARCTTRSLLEHGFTFTAGGQTRSGVRIAPDGPECLNQVSWGHGPSSVVLMEGVSDVYAAVRGGGRTAAAFGVMSYLDFGDAPQSYGVAGSAYLPTWSGGEVPTAGTVDLTGMQTAGSLASAGSPTTALGGVVDPESAPGYSAGADSDDLNATDTVGPADDEDALDTVDGSVHVTPGATTLTQTVRCTGTGTVQGWIDWNRDGAFATDTADLEASDQVVCPATGQATVTWGVPAHVWNAAAGDPSTLSTYMRLRIAAEASELAPTGISGSGEVEDYSLAIDRPVLTLVKEVDTTQAGPAASAQAGAWTLSATQGEGTAAGTALQGAGTATAVVMPGAFTLSETATGLRGYEAGQWVCAPTPGTTQPGYASTALDATVTVAAGDEVTCTIRNTAVPATVTWTKTDEIGLLLPGSAWELTTSTGQVLAVSDCVAAAQCPQDSTDRDPAAGKFTVTGLPWGQMTLTETAAPAGYVKSDQPLTQTVDGSRATPGAANVTVTGSFGAVVNVELTGSVTLTKTDPEGRLLDGSVWELTPVDDRGAAAGSSTTVTDCVAAVQCPEGSVDTDPGAGEFRVDELTAGRYALVETTAPPGYVLDSTPVYFTIDFQGQVNNLGARVNRMLPPVTLPLTGGMGSDIFILTGSVLVVLALGAVGVRGTLRHSAAGTHRWRRGERRRR
ncbi:MAG: CshA/CshB family fibrillar adhesin-related protein [Actinomyces sp.]|uniref:CshA/CshB family fibrillar adhesin-related protein n=1 Tax=Actinomyces sp. TaxID=29317 RepID=UPI0026DAD962|nr:CshA/CshB family fibrillar adhesin-related protein [Actinomyces sp.]MDO4244348.1 CshA/CshB family fibrillar adhesin-related protein [Actinomyces sp.]